MVMTEAGAAITRFDFPGGALRGTYLTLYANCLVHRSDTHLETLPLATIGAVRVAYERDSRKLNWGAGLVVLAAILLALSGPLSALAGGAAAEMAAAGGHGVARFMHGFFRFIEGFANLLPAAALAAALGGFALGALGWIGATTLTVSLAGSDRLYPVRGRNSGLLEFTEAVCERLMLLKR
jgi:hypothetical protein